MIEISSIFENINILKEKNFFKDTILMLIFSLLLILNIYLIKQKWIRNFHQSATIISLPIITYYITLAISGNIALSLGMVGALSIVRFRHPVRSPLELTIFFLQISIGIITTVNYKITIFFGSTILSIINFIFFTNIISKKIFKIKLFETTFSEINKKNYLEIETSEKIDSLDNNKLLDNYSFSKKNGINSNIYILSSDDKNELDYLCKNISKNHEKLILKIYKQNYKNN